MSTNFPGPRHVMGFVGFFHYGKLMGKPMYFPCNEVYHAGNRMGRKHPYYGENMSTNFPGPPRTMAFVAFSHTMGK